MDPFTWPSKSRTTSSNIHTAAMWGYHKPTDTQQYLHFNSHYPQNCIKSIPYTVARRIHTIITILNRSWRQHPTKQQLYGHIPPITKTIQIRRTRHARHCWRSRDELISDVLLWTPSHSRAKAGRPARTYIQQLC